MFLRLLVTVLIIRYAYAVSGYVVNQNTIETDFEIGCDAQKSIIIAERVYWSMSHQMPLYSNDVLVGTSAGFYITTLLDDSDTTFERFRNYGTMAQLNPTGKSSLNFQVTGSEMHNFGNLFVTNPLSVELIADSWINTGVIAISGPETAILPHVTMRSSGSSQLSNSGIICLTNQYFSMTSQLFGGGCIHVIDDSLLFLGNIDPSDPLDNIIVLDGPGASLGFTPSGATLTVAGFGGANLIEVCNDKILEHTYDEESGILTIKTQKDTDYFNIGTGYESEYFSNGYPSFVFYNAPVPNPIPSKCGFCPPPPLAPGFS